MYKLKGNARVNVLTEPLFGIPFNLYIPFFLSVGLFFQIAMAFLGGVLSDKFGRRRTTKCRMYYS